MDSPLLKSLSVGVGSVRQVIYAPSNFGFDATQASDDSTSTSNPNRKLHLNQYEILMFSPEQLQRKEMHLIKQLKLAPIILPNELLRLIAV
ncbi:unnamed protein product [Rhizoctonia solani]|uniref:Uncharacterized protein n=1 Tax=Rhizoctonia solani TaxID=456999 RepID=A0A8H3HUZ0_9AGAM|nr:unnamed protein product [Rhizoctonia solani]